jgi:hypothetical protein
MTMDDIRTTARLRNAIDEALARRGQLPADRIRTCDVDAVVDTNSVRCVIPPAVAERLGVIVRGQRLVEFTDGRGRVVAVTGPIIFDIFSRDTVEEALVLGDDVRIGYTVLAKLDLLADCANRRLVPNPAHPDQPVTKVK